MKIIKETIVKIHRQMNQFSETTLVVTLMTFDLYNVLLVL